MLRLLLHDLLDLLGDCAPCGSARRPPAAAAPRRSRPGPPPAGSPVGVIVNRPAGRHHDRDDGDQRERRPPAPVAARPPRSPGSRGRSRRARSASGRATVCPGFSRIEHSAGLRLSALIAEISIETDTATANWRNSSPLIPGMNATGTKTDSSTRVIAMIGAVISDIALLVACLGVRCGSSSMTARRSRSPRSRRRRRCRWRARAPAATRYSPSSRSPGARRRCRSARPARR